MILAKVEVALQNNPFSQFFSFVTFCSQKVTQNLNAWLFTSNRLSLQMKETYLAI